MGYFLLKNSKGILSLRIPAIKPKFVEIEHIVIYHSAFLTPQVNFQQMFLGYETTGKTEVKSFKNGYVQNTNFL